MASGTGDKPREADLGILGPDLSIMILEKLSSQEVASMARTSRFWLGTARDAGLWRRLVERDHGKLLPTLLASEAGRGSSTTGSAFGSSSSAALATSSSSVTEPDWTRVYRKGTALQQLKAVRWRRERQNRLRPCPREGHATCSWGDGGMLLFGGFRGGQMNDLHWLAPCRPLPPPSPAPPSIPSGGGTSGGGGSSTCRGVNAGIAASGRGAASAPSGTGGSGGGSGQAGGAGDGGDGGHLTSRSVEWADLPPVSGQPPMERYGHTITRCGRQGDMALVFGGMTMGGYFGEVTDPVLLRPTPGQQQAGAGVVGGGKVACGAVPAAMPPTKGGDGIRGGGSGQGQQRQQHEQQQLEWVRPDICGDPPAARGYHAATTSPDGTKVYIFGGISRRSACQSLAVLDLEAMRWEHPTTSGDLPPPRFGHSLVVWGGRLWVVGGGWGHDLLRSGDDYADVHYLDLATMEWHEPECANRCPCPEALGRCHASALVGSKLVFFGGSMEMCNDVVWLDLQSLEFGQPTRRGRGPCGRMSATCVAAPGQLLLFGGFAPGGYPGELGDLYRLQLFPDDLLPGGKQAAAAEDEAVMMTATGGSMEAQQQDEPLSEPRRRGVVMPDALLHALMAQLYGGGAGAALGGAGHDAGDGGDDDDGSDGTEEEEED